FRAMIQIEAEDLKMESYGVELLHAIGFTYSLKAKQYIGRNEMLGLPGFLQSMREKGHIFSETVSTLRSAIDLQNSFTQLQEAEKKGLDPEQKSKLEEAAATRVRSRLPKFVCCLFLPTTLIMLRALLKLARVCKHYGVVQNSKLRAY